MIFGDASFSTSRVAASIAPSSVIPVAPTMPRPVATASESMPMPTSQTPAATQPVATVVAPAYGVVTNMGPRVTQSGWFWAGVIGLAAVTSIIIFGRR